MQCIGVFCVYHAAFVSFCTHTLATLKHEKFMRYAEVFLRLGSALVGWMVVFAFVIWLAATRTVGCGPDGDEIYKLLLAMAPIASAVVFLVLVTRRLGEVHDILRWLSVPLLLLFPFALMSIWAVLNRANVESLSICANIPAALWERLWAPMQFIALLIIAYLLIRVLKKSVKLKQ